MEKESNSTAGAHAVNDGPRQESTLTDSSCLEFDVAREGGDDRSMPLLGDPLAATDETYGIHVALNELDRLAKAAREAMFKCEKYRALSSLVAIPPLVSHIMDTCSQMSTDTSSRQASECRAGSEGYL